MNSVLQQFFMVPGLRYNLLCVDDDLPENGQDYKGETVDDNLLHQLQTLMANLEVSETIDYNPWQFCYAFKELDGGPTNTGEQKDAQEFLNLVFERLENALKATSRKYLLQSVFGGQTCSQLICSECGKVKNRLEDFYNLSLTVKDIKGMHESLAKLVEGEVISDYECSGCKRKVDVRKRTLIAHTPNVLVVHLQRIIFNFDTFQNDKINQHFEFPQILDLAPYSYYEVMGQENRLKGEKGEADGEDSNIAAKEEAKAAEGDADKEEDDDNQEPGQEDCFEYKLAGVTVHSGTAHAGHYWSYINTKRGREEAPEDEGGAAWGETDNDCWMEFNDSTVRDFQASKLKEECFGGDSAGSGGFGLSSLDGWGLSGSYGKSGYLLFFEKRKKKPLKLLVKDGVEAAKSEKVASAEDKNQSESKKENEKDKEEEQLLEVDYREAVRPTETPNRIFQKVLEENRKYGFENDIYSADFFDLSLAIQKTVAGLDGADQSAQELRRLAVEMGGKATLELLAKTYNNSCIDEHTAALAQLMRADPSQSL